MSLNRVLRYVFLFAAVINGLIGLSATLVFTGNAHKLIVEKPEASTGLTDIFVLYSTDGVTASYTAKSSSVRWLKYSNLGGGYAEEVAPDVNGDVYSIPLSADDMGYIIEDGDSRYYCWVVNYSKHLAVFNSLGFSADQDCDRARLRLDGDASRIQYFTINGQPKDLSRALTLSYSTLEYDEATEEYIGKNAEEIIASIDGDFSVPVPYCDTQFTLTGDRFLKEWGMSKTVTSATFQTTAVQARTTASQEGRENDNEQKVESESLGGSAPVYVHFHAAVTDAAIFQEWQLSKDSNFEIIDDRYQQLDFDYTFQEQGTTYVRFMANNAEGTCEYVSDTYPVFVGESALLCPNAFSPGASEGVNDEWKVSYKSLISFECHIFNRWGQEMISFTDPSQGWDGKYKGKLVPTGAYYYVIKAEGSDGKKYKLSGDINIIRVNEDRRTSNPEEVAEPQ